MIPMPATSSVIKVSAGQVRLHHGFEGVWPFFVSYWFKNAGRTEFVHSSREQIFELGVAETQRRYFTAQTSCKTRKIRPVAGRTRVADTNF